MKWLLWLLCTAQGLLGLRVIARMLGTARRGQKLGEDGIEGRENATVARECVAVIVPVLNEYRRLAPCLEGLMEQGEEVKEILVVDGGSEDGTQELVASYARRDGRIKLVDASPVPGDWNGKAWGLQVGVEAADTRTRWILTIDADVRPRRGLVPALLAQARRQSLTALSIATTQELNSAGEGLLHPAMLATLVYRFGVPGGVFRHVHEVQANGQCFLVERAALATIDNFRATRSSICEDVTLARLLVDAGYRVGFYEDNNKSKLVSVRMYENWRELWRNWSRSLPMRDRFTGWHALSEWLEIAIVQALPLPLCIALCIPVVTHVTQRRGRWLLALNGVLLALRFGVLVGTGRAYQRRPWTYWLSPLCDVPVTLQLARQTVRRRHTWRGRPIIRA